MHETKFDNSMGLAFGYIFGGDEKVVSSATKYIAIEDTNQDLQIVSSPNAKATKKHGRFRFT